MRRLDVPNATERYLAGESVEDIAESAGVSCNVIRRIVKEAGVLRSVTEAQRLRFGTPEFDHAEAARLYAEGMSEQAIALKIGTSRAVIRKALIGQSVQLRGRQAASLLHMSQTTREQRLALTEAAHAAVRGVPHSEKHREKTALTREDRRTQASPSEILLADMLTRQGIEVVPQKAIGRYNVDIALTESSVAVEVFGGHWHASGFHAERYRKRIDYLLDRGWMPVIIWVTNAYPLRGAALDYIVALHEIRRTGKSSCREEHVIRGDGEGGPVSEGYPANVPVIPCYKS